MNWENLVPNLSFTENNMGNLQSNKAVNISNLMRYSITSIFKNLSMNWDKFIHWEKWNFEIIMNSAHTTKRMALVKVQNQNFDYLMYYPITQYVK